MVGHVEDEIDETELLLRPGPLDTLESVPGIMTASFVSVNLMVKGDDGFVTALSAQQEQVE